MSKSTVQTQTEFPKLETREEVAEEVNKSLSWKGGHVRGVSLKSDSFRAIQEMGGDGAGEQVIELLNELGADVDVRTLRPYEWYPAGYGPALYLAASHLFSWEPDDVVELGRVSTHGSMLIKIIMRFVSVQRTLQGAPTIWKKYYDFAELIPGEYSEEERFITFTIKGYDVHPINEFYHAGYYKGIIELVTGSDQVTIEVPQSVYRGDEYSTYKLSW